MQSQANVLFVLGHIGGRGLLSIWGATQGKSYCCLHGAHGAFFVLVYLLWWLHGNFLYKMPNYLLRLVICFCGASTNFHLQGNC
jgi:hypothetical protein